jgi:hypothetical protein
VGIDTCVPQRKATDSFTPLAQYMPQGTFVLDAATQDPTPRAPSGDARPATRS